MKIKKGDKFRYKHNKAEFGVKEFFFEENEIVRAIMDGIKKSRLSLEKFTTVTNGRTERDVWLENLEPINKFEVGEEVIYKGKKVDIFGIDKTGEFAAIQWKKEGFTNTITTTHINKLSKLKKKNELEKGDKFITDMGDKVEVIAGEYCEIDKTMKYLGKRLSDGYVTYWRQHEIEEVIQ